MKRIVVLFLWFYCTTSFAVLNIPNEKPGSSVTVTVESPQVKTKFNQTAGGFNCDHAGCLLVEFFAGTDMLGKTTWARHTSTYSRIAKIEGCSSSGIEAGLKGQSYLGEVMSSGLLDDLIPPSKKSYRTYGYCVTKSGSNYDWSTLDQPWDGIPPPVCGLSGPDVIDFGELKPAAVSGKSKKARYTISCDKKATVKVTFAFASGSSSEKIADDLTLALKVGTKEGVKGETYTVEKSAVQADLSVALKSGGAAPVGEYQASAVVKLTVE
ncbi:Uncharacterised protein [Serratia grimesii]|jgi:hypothetical protein|uniref:hypothetical protein n=1 Tax=Serratia grimesii TaxID=82995 RepID=UPI00076F39A7|nr:hypothetical protein [Serratia grimesii]CUW22143.1 Uncharacterised protein [Serratia grimesii]SMZ57482.1 Uncharacterised protein [Serratia grimesii]